MQQNRRSGNGWIGWLIFIVLVFGSRFLPPIAAWLSRQTGLQISTGMLVAAIVGVGVVLTISISVIQEINRNRRQDGPRLPTGIPPASPPPPTSPPRAPTMPASPARPRSGGPSQPRLSSGEQRLPGPPRFEPIIDPRVLAFGIIGLVIFGGFFFTALLISGALP